MSLRRRFIVVFVAFAAALAGAFGWLSWRHTKGALERELDDKLILVGGAATAVGLDGHTVQTFRPEDVNTRIFRAYRERLVSLRRYVADAYLLRRGGTLLVSTEHPDSLPVGSRLRRLEAFPREMESAWAEGEATTPLFRGEDGRWYKYGFVRLQDSDAMLAVLMRADFLEPLVSFRRSVIVGSVAAALVAAILAGGLATTIIEPLERLARAALRIQEGRMDEPVEPEAAEELGRLAGAMERMRRSILERDEQLRLMLAQVAHEIRNPLGGLELFASAASETDDPAERRGLLERVRTEVTALNRIIDDFLTFARPMEPEPVVHDVRGPLSEAVELARGEAERRGRALEVRFPPEPVWTRADPDHVKRIALNLLRNAVQVASRVGLAADDDGGEAVVRVRDDGPGVPERLRERIFDPFVSEKEQGAGLGLAIVKRLAEVNGGRVEVADRGGGQTGAEFRVYFPEVRTVPATASAPAVGGAAGRS